jgi:hypothetical protein
MIVYVAFEFTGVDPNSVQADEIVDMITEECDDLQCKFNATACWLDNAVVDTKENAR